MRTSPPEGSRLLANLQLVVATLGGSAAIFLAFMAVPNFAAWARAPLISPLTAALVALVLAIGATALVTVTRATVVKRQGELEAMKEKNLRLESVMDELRIAAYYDVLTGVPNSRYLKRVLSEPRKSDEVRCLILLDIEKFGEINKKHGHWKGDAYLSKFAGMVLESSRRNEYLIKRRPVRAEDEKLEIQTFRRYSGGDEFYILLNGTVPDGLGYLSRLHRRAGEFNQMAIDALGSPHRFSFRAGLVSITYQDAYETAAERAADALGKAAENPGARVYWPPHETLHLDDREKPVVQQAIEDFGDPFKTP